MAVICGCDSVFGNDKIALEFLMNRTNHIGKCFRIEFIGHLGQLRILGRIDLTEEPETAAGVVLHSDKIIVLDVGQVMTKFGIPFLLRVFLAKPLRLHIV